MSSVWKTFPLLDAQNFKWLRDGVFMADITTLRYQINVLSGKSSYVDDFLIFVVHPV